MIRLLLAVVLCGASVVCAAPRKPASGDEVLLRVPAAAQSEGLAALRAAVVADPGNRVLAHDLAQRYLQLGRTTDDPRFVAYADSTLRPWVQGADVSPDVLITAANAAQYLHQFDKALQLLDRALAREPRNAQALLVRAGLLEVRGDLTAARSGCAKLAAVTAELVAITCLSSVASRSGHLQQSFDNLASLLASSPRLPDEVHIWLLTILADMADRLGDVEQQQRYLQTARQLAPQDLKLKAAVADCLLAQRRYAEAATLLRDDEQNDALLLRLAIATHSIPESRGADAQRYATMFRERQALAGGEGRHRRELARFLLDVDGDVAGAARLARENWAVQREPADLRLLLRAARGSGDRELLALGEAWIEEHHYEDRRLE